MGERRHRSWIKAALIATIVLSPILYVALFGPVCWLVGRGILSDDTAARCYRIVLKPDSVWMLVWSRRYARLWALDADINQVQARIAGLQNADKPGFQEQVQRKTQTNAHRARLNDAYREQVTAEAMQRDRAPATGSEP